MKPYVHMFDGVTLHNYSPSTRSGNQYQYHGDRISWYAGYPRASAAADVAQQLADFGGLKKPIWLTEFQAGLDPPTNCTIRHYDSSL